MQETLEQIGMMVFKGVAVPVVALFLAWASAHVPGWIATKVKNAKVAGVLERLTALAFTVVQEVQQTVVSKLGDTADAAALLAARDQALATLKSHLGDKGLQEIEDVLGLKDQDAVIKLLISFIESSVHSLKLQNADAGSTTVVVPPAVIPVPLPVTPAA